MIDCKNRPVKVCQLFPARRLKGVLQKAADAFFAALDGYTLSGLLNQPSEIKELPGLHVQRGSNLNKAKGHHGLCNANKAGNVGAVYVVARRSELLGCFMATVVDAFHNFLQPFLREFIVP